MMWVVRSGKAGIYYQKYINDCRIYLPWDGYHMDLSSYSSFTDYRDLVIKEKNPESDTSVSNWASQLYYFTHGIAIGDYVLIPGPRSLKYVLAVVTGSYEFCKDSKLYHSRRIKIISQPIPRSIFTQRTQHSLGAFRTVFKVKQETEILTLANEKYNVNQNNSLFD